MCAVFLQKHLKYFLTLTPFPFYFQLKFIHGKRGGSNARYRTRDQSHPHPLNTITSQACHAARAALPYQYTSLVNDVFRMYAFSIILVYFSIQ